MLADIVLTVKPLYRRLIIFVLLATGNLAAGSPKQQTPTRPLQQTITWHGKKVRIASNAILVRFRPGVSLKESNHLLASYHLARKRHLSSVRADVVVLSNDVTVEETLNRLSRRDEIEFAEPNLLNSLHSCPDPVPNDFSYQVGQQYNLCRVGMDRVWTDPNIVGGFGLDSVVVAVLDTGVGVDHPDFATSASCTRILTPSPCPGLPLGLGFVGAGDRKSVV